MRLKRVLAVAGLLAGTLVGNAATEMGSGPTGASAATLNKQLVVLGEGFHTCENPSASTLSAWFNNGPFYALGLYLGGNNGAVVGCTDNGNTKWQYAAGDGYRLFPFYYSYQLPASACGGPSETYQLSLNTTTAYNEGVSVADNAASEAGQHELGFGVVLYLDLEGFSNPSTTCLNAAYKFVDGWDTELKFNTQYYGGLYGSTCASHLQNFATSGLQTVPLAIAPDDTGDSPTGVFGLQCLPNNYWAHDQRIHQTQSEVSNRSFGGASIAYVDGDCADGPTATQLASDENPGNCAKF